MVVTKQDESVRTNELAHSGNEARADVASAVYYDDDEAGSSLNLWPTKTLPCCKAYDLKTGGFQNYRNK